jgi:inner membrane protein
VDNFTHALVGLALADAVALSLPSRPSPRVRGLLRVASAITNNVPDLDFVYAGITPGKLGYLLHHRGHTHTLLAGMVLGALTFALAVAWARRRGLALSRAETWALGGLATLGPWAHVGMDALNSYGVHPFWPLYDGWLYGDAVFIIEPWFWVLSIPPLALASVTRFGRVFLAVSLGAALLVAWVVPIVGWVTALLLTLGSAVTVVVSGRLSEQGRGLLALGGYFAVMLVFGVGARLARTTLNEVLDTGRGSGGGVAVVDAVLTPAPGNPLCWQAVVVGRRDGAYVLEVAHVSLAPGVMPASACHLGPSGASLGLRPSSRSPTARAVFQGDYAAPLAELRTLARTNCHVAAFLGFARAPFWLPRGENLYLGDLRYDREEEDGFAELEVPAHASQCPPWLPPWTPPRQDLLE